MTKIHVDDAQAVLVSENTLTSGMVNRGIQFTFADTWDGLSKKAVFKCGNIVKDRILDETGETDIPHECLIAGQTLFIGVYGFTVDDTDPDDPVIEKAIPTIYCDGISVEAGADPSGDEGDIVSPTTAEQLQSEIDDLGGRLDTAESDIEAIGERVSDTEQDIDDINDELEDKMNYPSGEGGIVKSLTFPDGTHDTTTATEYLDYQPPIFVQGILKGTGGGHFVQATPDVDYATPESVEDVADDVSDLQEEIGDRSGKSDTVTEEIDNISDLIPDQASSANQLADKNFVNSSIGTNTANYISNAGQPFTSVAQLEAYAGTVTNNDYAFVTGTDAAGNTYFDRYKATVSGGTVSWAKEYRLNNSSFTASQWAAIESGITASDVAQIETNKNNIASLGTSKQDKITASGLLKGDGAGGVEEAVEGTDYQAPLTPGTDYQEPLIAGQNITINGNVISASGGGGDSSELYNRYQADDSNIVLNYRYNINSETNKVVRGYKSGYSTSGLVPTKKGIKYRIVGRGYQSMPSFAVVDETNTVVYSGGADAFDGYYTVEDADAKFIVVNTTSTANSPVVLYAVSEEVEDTAEDFDNKVSEIYDGIPVNACQADDSNIYDGKAWSDAGGSIHSVYLPAYMRTQMFPTRKGIKYRICADSFQSSKVYYILDKDKTVLSTRNSSINGILTITDDGARYICINHYKNGAHDFMFYGISEEVEKAIPNDYAGLAGVAFGTSLTYRSKSTGGYLSQLESVSGIVFNNQGHGSTGFMTGGDISITNTILGYTDYANKQIATIEGSVNDWGKSKTLGTYTDTGTTSVCGCLRTCIDHILTQNPSIMVFVIFDHYGDTEGTVPSAVVNNLTQYQYYEEMAKVCESMGVPYYKGYAMSGMNDKTPYFYIDNIHLSAEGVEHFGNCVWGCLRNIPFKVGDAE